MRDGTFRGDLRARVERAGTQMCGLAGAFMWDTGEHDDGTILWSGPRAAAP